ncbi:hypothetical protein Cgig2_018131 [Carnegiea gigantea]|uniref:Uncharacterized protein n=1 Tax=Carnegiea gigantea TaxID=171969 RepID=A0A9Q1QR53_9CARY|nr:hypothetical protein Cgig2_018131 [Carnegiea gigantea]
MKLNKSKGKVHPSPSSSSSSSSSPSSSSLSVCSNDPISSLNQLLPAAILTLISVLSLQDREVLAYMISRSLHPSPSPSPSPAPVLKSSKKSGSTRQHIHKSPIFDCDCFECYTAYWFRWDSSPHRELIHQAIEAFEDPLATTEQPKKTGRSTRRREKEKAVARCETPVAEIKKKSPEIAPGVGSPSENGETPTSERKEREREEEMNGGHGKQLQQQHKGLARKMLPDVIGGVCISWDAITVNGRTHRGGEGDQGDVMGMRVETGFCMQNCNV